LARLSCSAGVRTDNSLCSFATWRNADPNPAQDHGFMYSRSIEDPDGNVWEIMWMDVAAHEK
jgi:predicted lactoylglutathione lyase